MIAVPVTIPGTRRPDAAPEVRRVILPTRPPADARGGGGDGRHGDDGGGSDTRPGWPLWLAVGAVVMVASLLTALGMFSQILANLAGSQLPGA